MTASEALPPRRRLWLVYLPLLVFAGVAAMFFANLRGGDPSRLPSALVGKPAPVFSLPPLDPASGAPGLDTAALKQGHPTLVNVFASWCVPCRDEHPALLALSRGGLPDGATLVGLAYKDDPANAAKFLGDLGDPYARIGADVAGRVGIDFGVYGVPETFVVRGDGIIAYKFIGPLTLDSVRSTLLPEVIKAALAAD